MAKQHIRYGSWWMIQFCSSGWISFGFHIDPRIGRTYKGVSFGPYADLYVGPVTLSIGRRPYLTHGDMLQHPQSRGGLNPSEF